MYSQNGKQLYDQDTDWGLVLQRFLPLQKKFVSWVHSKDKTAGYHWHIFRTLILLKIPFKSMKTFFFKRYILFGRKTSPWKDIFKKLDHSIRIYSKFSALTVLKKSNFSRINPFIFPKNPPFIHFQKSYFLVAFCGKFAIIWVVEKHSNSEPSNIGQFLHWTLSIGK